MVYFKGDKFEYKLTVWGFVFKKWENLNDSIILFEPVMKSCDIDFFSILKEYKTQSKKKLKQLSASARCLI